MSGGKTPAPKSKTRVNQLMKAMIVKLKHGVDEEDESDEESSEESEEDDEESSSEEESEDENVKPNKRGARKAAAKKKAASKMDVKDMKVSELRNELKKLGLDHKGLKAQLQRRLKKALK